MCACVCREGGSRGVGLKWSKPGAERAAVNVHRLYDFRSPSRTGSQHTADPAAGAGGDLHTHTHLDTLTRTVNYMNTKFKI